MLAKAYKLPRAVGSGQCSHLSHWLQQYWHMHGFHARMQVSSGRRLLVEMIMTKNAEATDGTPEWR